jgi:hypothetical protein
MDLLTLTFDQAYREIGRRTFVTELKDIGERMALMGKMAKIAGVYRAVRAKEPRRETNGQHFRVPNIWELRRHGDGDAITDCPPFEHLCDEISTWLTGKFPMLEDPTFALWSDNSDDSTLMYLVNPGIDLDWDEAAELFECPQNFTQDYGLMILPIYAVFFGQFIGEDQEYPAFWNPAAEWFGWNVEMPWWLWLEDNLWSTDNKKFYRLLEKAGLPNVADTFRMAWHDTGTFFLDLEDQHDSYYNENDCLWDFTVENIEKLTRLWDEARPIHDRGYQACHEACEHPEMYKTIVELLGRCIVPMEKKRTLKELKAAAAENKKQAADNSEGSEEEDDDTE